MYSTAIADYIKAFEGGEATVPDTLYIDEEPPVAHLKLPAVIQGRVIRIVPTSVSWERTDSADFALLNVVHTGTPDEVKFIIVRFQQGMSHYPDGLADVVLNYRVDRRTGTLKLMSRHSQAVLSSER